MQDGSVVSEVLNCGVRGLETLWTKRMQPKNESHRISPHLRQKHRTVFLTVFEIRDKMERLNLFSLLVKTFKFILTVVILVLYRVGNNGDFLGVGGTFKLFHDQIPDVEILASGVIVGYLLYNLCVVISYAVTKERLANDCLMNIIGIFLWLGVAGTALHYWHNYKYEWRMRFVGPERDAGLALGSLCVFNGLLHVIDAALALKLFLDQEDVRYRPRKA